MRGGWPRRGSACRPTRCATRCTHPRPHPLHLLHPPAPRRPAADALRHEHAPPPAAPAADAPSRSITPRLRHPRRATTHSAAASAQRATARTCQTRYMDATHGTSSASSSVRTPTPRALPRPQGEPRSARAAAAAHLGPAAPAAPAQQHILPLRACAERPSPRMMHCCTVSHTAGTVQGGSEREWGAHRRASRETPIMGSATATHTQRRVHPAPHIPATAEPSMSRSTTSSTQF